MPPASAAKCRKWCFTYCNPPKNKSPDEIYGDSWVVEYMVVGAEIAPTTGTPHHQGYVRFANPRALNGVRKLLPTAHWEPVKGTEADNFKYCSKEGKIILECGTREVPADDANPEKTKQGKRNDIVTARKMVAAGCGMRQIVDQVNSYQAIKCADLMLRYYEAERNWKPDVTWLYGPTGTGKTAHARACADPDDVWFSGRDGRWFEGYDAHTDVIFDDVREDFCDFHIWLRLLDRYPYRVEVKGSSRQFLARRIWITSSLPPEALFRSRKGEDIRQLLRRLTHIIHVSAPGIAEEILPDGATAPIEFPNYVERGEEFDDEDVKTNVPEHGTEQKSGGNTTLEGPALSAPPEPERRAKPSAALRAPPTKDEKIAAIEKRVRTTPPPQSLEEMNAQSAAWLELLNELGE